MICGLCIRRLIDLERTVLIFKKRGNVEGFGDTENAVSPLCLLFHSSNCVNVRDFEDGRGSGLY